MTRSISAWQIILVALVIGLLSSCYKEVEGCLDPEATNYDIDGDINDPDACTYPRAKVSIFHLNADTALTLGDTLINDIGQSYILLDYVFLLSEFEVSLVGGETHVVSDSVLLLDGDEEVKAKDDIIRVSRGTFTYDIGSMIYEGKVENLSFVIGLQDQLNDLRFVNEISRHPLTTDPDSLFQDATDDYVFQRIKVVQGIGLVDTVIYDITGPTVPISFPIDYDSDRAKDKTLQIEAQYQLWFDGVDFEGDSKTEIETKIQENSKTIFSARE